MREFSVNDDILPIHEFKAKASAIIGRVRKTGRPVVVTQNGRASVVVISTRDYDRLAGVEPLRRALAEADDDVANGRVVDHEAVFSAIESRVTRKRR